MKKEALETGQGVSAGQAAAAHCSPGCKSCGDPESLGGSKKFVPEKGYALERALSRSLS